MAMLHVKLWKPVWLLSLICAAPPAPWLHTDGAAASCIACALTVGKTVHDLRCKGKTAGAQMFCLVVVC